MKNRTRKVQKTGRASFIITLPKSWIKRNKVEKGESLKYNVLPNGDLLLSPIGSVQKSLSKKFTINEDKSPNEFYRELLGSYMAGNNRIKIETENRIPAQVRDVINKFIDSVIGLKIGKETDNCIYIEELTVPSLEEMQNSLGRMARLVDSMHKDAIKSLKEENFDLANSVIRRDEEINQLSRLIFHIATQIFQEISKLHSLEFSLKEGQCYIIHSIKLENIGDYSVSIAKNLLELLELESRTQMEEIVRDLEKVSELVLKILNKGINAWNKKDSSLTKNCFETHELVSKKCDDLIQKLKNLDSKVSIPINNIVENLRQTSKISLNIAYLTIDFLIDEE